MGPHNHTSVFYYRAYNNIYDERKYRQVTGRYATLTSTYSCIHIHITSAISDFLMFFATRASTHVFWYSWNKQAMQQSSIFHCEAIRRRELKGASYNTRYTTQLIAFQYTHLTHNMTGSMNIGQKFCSLNIVNDRYTDRL